MFTDLIGWFSLLSSSPRNARLCNVLQRPACGASQAHSCGLAQVGSVSLRIRNLHKDPGCSTAPSWKLTQTDALLAVPICILRRRDRMPFIFDTVTVFGSVDRVESGIFDEAPTGSIQKITPTLPI